MLRQLASAFDNYKRFEEECAKLQGDSIEVLGKRLKLINQCQADMATQYDYLNKESSKIERQVSGEKKSLLQRLIRKNEEIDLKEYGGKLNAGEAISRFEEKITHLKFLHLKTELELILNSSRIKPDLKADLIEQLQSKYKDIPFTEAQRVEIHQLQKKNSEKFAKFAVEQIHGVYQDNTLSAIKKQKKVHFLLVKMFSLIGEDALKALKNSNEVKEIYDNFNNEINSLLVKEGSDKQEMQRVFEFKRQIEDHNTDDGKKLLEDRIASLDANLRQQFPHELSAILATDASLIKKYRDSQNLIAAYTSLLNKKLPEDLATQGNDALKKLKQEILAELSTQVTAVNSSSIGELEKAIKIRQLVAPILLTIGELPDEVTKSLANAKITPDKAKQALISIAEQETSTLDKIQQANNIISLLMQADGIVPEEVKVEYQKVKEQLFSALTMEIIFVSRDLLGKLNTDELLEPGNFQNSEKSPTLSAVTQHSNNITDMVKASILSLPDENAAALAMRDWIRVAEDCRQQGDYLAFAAIALGLKSCDKLTPLLSNDEKKLIDIYGEMISPEGSSAAMRGLLDLEKDKKGLVPPLAIYTKDLEFLDAGNPGQFKTMPETLAIIQMFKALAEKNSELVAGPAKAIPKTNGLMPEVQAQLFNHFKLQGKTTGAAIVTALPPPLSPVGQQQLTSNGLIAKQAALEKQIQTKSDTIFKNKAFYLLMLDPERKSELDTFLDETISKEVKVTFKSNHEKLLKDPTAANNLRIAIEANNIEAIRKVLTDYRTTHPKSPGSSMLDFFDVIDIKGIKDVANAWQLEGEQLKTQMNISTTSVSSAVLSASVTPVIANEDNMNSAFAACRNFQKLYESNKSDIQHQTTMINDANELIKVLEQQSKAKIEKPKESIRIKFLLGTADKPQKMTMSEAMSKLEEQLNETRKHRTELFSALAQNVIIKARAIANESTRLAPIFLHTLIDELDSLEKGFERTKIVLNTEVSAALHEARAKVVNTINISMEEILKKYDELDMAQKESLLKKLMKIEGLSEGPRKLLQDEQEKLIITNSLLVTEKLSHINDIHDGVERLQELNKLAQNKQIAANVLADIEKSRTELIVQLQQEITASIDSATNTEQLFAVLERMITVYGLVKKAYNFVDPERMKSYRQQIEADCQKCINLIVAKKIEEIDRIDVSPEEKITAITKAMEQITSAASLLRRTDETIGVRPIYNQEAPKPKGVNEYRVIVNLANLAQRKNTLSNDLKVILDKKITAILSNEGMNDATKILQISRFKNKLTLLKIELDASESDALEKWLQEAFKNLGKNPQKDTADILQSIYQDNTKPLVDRLNEIHIIASAVYGHIEKFPQSINEIIATVTHDIAEEWNNDFRKQFLQIDVQQLSNFGKSTGTETFIASVNNFNEKTAIIVTSILELNDLKTAQAVIKQWILIADRMVQENNVDAAMSIMAALNSPLISRLVDAPSEGPAVAKMQGDYLEAPVRETLLKLNTLLDGQKDISQALPKTGKALVPFVGFYVGQLIKLSESEAAKTQLGPRVAQYQKIIAEAQGAVRKQQAGTLPIAPVTIFEQNMPLFHADNESAMVVADKISKSLLAADEEEFTFKSLSRTITAPIRALRKSGKLAMTMSNSHLEKKPDRFKTTHTLTTSLSKSGLKTTLTETTLSKKINNDVAELISMPSSNEAEKINKEKAIYDYAIKRLPSILIKSAKEGSLESALDDLDRLFSTTEKLMTAANVGYFEDQWNEIIKNLNDTCKEIRRDTDNFALLQNKIINIQERLNKLVAPMKSTPVTSGTPLKLTETVPLSEISAKAITELDALYQQCVTHEDKIKFIIDQHRKVEDWYLNPPDSMTPKDIAQVTNWLNNKITKDLGVPPFIFTITEKTLKNTFDDAVNDFKRMASKTILNEEELNKAHEKVTTLYLQYKLRKTGKDVVQFGTTKTKLATELTTLSPTDRAYDEVHKQFNEIRAGERVRTPEVLSSQPTLPTIQPAPKLVATTSAPARLYTTQSITGAKVDLTDSDIKPIAVSVPERTESFNYKVYEEWELYWQLYDDFLLNAIAEQYQAAPSAELRELYKLQQKKMASDSLDVSSNAYLEASRGFDALKKTIPLSRPDFISLRLATHQKVCEALQFDVKSDVIAAVDNAMYKESEPHDYQAAYKGRLLIVIKTPPQNAEAPFNELQSLKTELQLDLNQGQAIRDFSNPNIIHALKDAAASIKSEEHQQLVNQFITAADRVERLAKEIREHKEEDPVKLAEFIQAKLKENNNYSALIMLDLLGLDLAVINADIGRKIIAHGQTFNSITSQGRNWIGKYPGHLKKMDQADLANKFDAILLEANDIQAKRTARIEAFNQFKELSGGASLFKTQVSTSDLNILINEVKELLTPFVKDEEKRASAAERELLLSKMNQLLDDILKKCTGKLDKELTATEIDDIKQMLQIAKSLALFTSEVMNVTEFIPRQIVELNTVIQQLKAKNPDLTGEAEDFQRYFDQSLQDAIATIETPLVITTPQQMKEKFAGLAEIQKDVLKALSQVAEKQQMLTLQLARAVTSEEHEKVINKAEIAFTDPMRTLILWVDQSKLNISDDTKKELLKVLYDEQAMLSDYVSRMKTIANAKMLETRPRVGAIARSASPAQENKIARRAIVNPVLEISPNIAEVWAAKLATPLTPQSFIEFRESNWEIYWKLYDEKLSATHNSLAAHLAVAQSLNLSVPEQRLKELDTIASRASDDYKQIFQRAVRPNLNVQFPDSWRNHWEHFDKQALSDEQFKNTETRLALHREALKRVGYSEQAFNNINDMLLQADAYAWQRSDGDGTKYRENFEKYIKGRFNLNNIIPEMYKNPRKLARLADILGEKKDPTNQDLLTKIIDKYGKDNARLLSGFAALVAKLYKIYEDYNRSDNDLTAFEQFTDDLEANYKTLVELQFYYQDLMALLENDIELKDKANEWNALVIAAVQVVSSTLPAIKDVIESYSDIDPQSEDLARITTLRDQYKKISEISNFHQRMIDTIKAIKTFPTDSKKIEALNSQLMTLKDALREYILQPEANLLRDKINQQLKSVIPVLLQNIDNLSSKAKLDDKQAETLRLCFDQVNNLMQLSDQINGVPYPFTVEEKQQLQKSCQLASNLIDAEKSHGLRDVIHYLLNHDIEIISSALVKIDVKSVDTIEAKLKEKMKDKKMKVDEDEVDLFTAAKKFNPREEIQFINEKAWDDIKLSNPLLDKYSLTAFTSVFDNYLKIKAALENLTSFRFNNEKDFTYIKDGQTRVIDEAEWKELQQQNPLLLAISFEKAKEHYAAVRILSADYQLINGALAKRSVNREPAYIAAVSVSVDPEVAILRNILPLIDLIQTYHQFKLPQKLGSYQKDELIAALTMITGGTEDGAEREKSILVTYDNLKKLLQDNGLLDDQLSKQLDAEKAQFADMAQRLEQAIAAKEKLYSHPSEVTLPKRLGVLQRLGEVFGLTRVQPISETSVIKNEVEEMRVGTEAPLTSSATATTVEAKPKEKSLFSYLRDTVMSVVDRIRGKKAPTVQPTRDASISEVSEVLYGNGNSKTVSSTDLPPPPSQLLAAKAPRDISGQLPPAPTLQTVSDLYSDESLPVETRSEERIKEQAQSTPIESPLTSFIKLLRNDIEVRTIVDQDNVNDFMDYARLQTLSKFNKEELIEVAKVHREVAQWLLNHAENTDATYKAKLGEDGLAQVRQLVEMPKKVTSRSGASGTYQTLTIDEIEQAILDMRDDNDKPYVKAAEFVAFERFSSVIKTILPTLPKKNQKAERSAIELALIKHNIRVAQPYDVVPPNEYKQKLHNFNASLSLFNNVIVVALHSLLEKLNFTNHYEQLIKIREDLVAQQKHIESYQHALGKNLSDTQIASMELSEEDIERRNALLNDAQTKLNTIDNEIERIDNLRNGFTQGVQKKLQAVRAFLPKPPLELPTHTQSDSNITVTPPKPVPDVKEQIYVKVKDKNEFKPLPKEQQNTLITEMHFKVDKNAVTSHVPRKTYDEPALRALAKAMVLKAREAYGKETPLKIEGKGKLLEFAQEEYQKLLKLEAEPAALKRENSVKMPPRPKSTPSS